jgi:hypothetical protein
MELIYTGGTPPGSLQRFILPPVAMVAAVRVIDAVAMVPVAIVPVVHRAPPVVGTVIVGAVVSVSVSVIRITVVRIRVRTAVIWKWKRQRKPDPDAHSYSGAGTRYSGKCKTAGYQRDH